MQLVPHEIRWEDSSETEPIILHPSDPERLEESTSSIVISVAVDSSVAADDTSGLNVDENISLVRRDQRQCRICLDIEELIAPCHCKGTQKYVHRSYLDNWRSTKI